MKISTAALLVAFVASVQCFDSKIASGYSAKAGQVKCYVSMLIEGDSYSKTCGGCLLFPEERILTSASCVFSATEGEASSIKFYIGLKGPTGKPIKVHIDDIYAASGYTADKNTSTNDLAIIILKNRVKTSSTFSATFPILEDRADAFVGEDLVVCGHGYMDNNKTKPGSNGLQCTTLNVVPAVECVAAMKPKSQERDSKTRRKRRLTTMPLKVNVMSIGFRPDEDAAKGIICTRNNDDRNACGGDQGSPVFSNKTGSLALVGVVSLYPDTRPNARCKDGHMVVVTQLGSFRDFINNPTAPPAKTTEPARI